MAQGVFRHRSLPGRPQWSRQDVAASLRRRWDRQVLLARRDPRLFVWSILWLPFRIASDAPAPDLPSRRARASRAAFTDPAGAYLAARVDHTVRAFGRAWLAGSLLRGLTLALLVITLWAMLAVIGIAGLPGWTAVIGIMVVGLGIGAFYGWCIRPDRMMVASMMDHTFALRERIVSAFDRPADAGHVSRLQLADAANTFDDIMTDIPRSTFLPVREAAICLIVAGALVTMLLAYIPHHAIAAVAESPVPQFVPASERLAAPESPIPPEQPPDQAPSDSASIAQIQERSRESQSTQDDLSRLGKALEGHAITQPAASAIANGDYAAAAESLRAASKAAATASQAERDALADDLEAAAQEISESNPELAQAANDAADALREGGPEAESALADLADQVDQSREKVQSPDDMARDLDEAQTGSSDPSQGQGEESEASQSQSGDQQQPSNQDNASDPGEGSAAKPGVSNQEQEPSDSDSSSDEPSAGNGNEPGDPSSSPPEGGDGSSTDAQPGEGSDPSSSDSAQNGSSSQQPMEGAPDEETDASQGSGAGTGQSNANDQTTNDGSNDDATDPSELTPAADEPGNGEAGDPPPSREDRGEDDDSRGTDSESATTLELEGTSSEGIDTGGDSGSSSLGSGTGTSTANGDQAQTSVGVAGPDSNRVPDSLRDVVKDYFEVPEP
jgi:hypothetical protein